MQNNEELRQRILETRELLKHTPIKALEKALALQIEHPDSELVMLLVARCQRFCNQLDASQEILQAIIIKTPLNVIARMELAALFNQKKQYHAAINLLTETTSLVPEYHEVWDILSQHLLQVGEVERARHASAQYEMIKKFNVSLARANEHFKGERFEEAESICRELLKQIPGEIRTLKLLAKIASHFTHYEVAISTMELCVQQKPEDVQIGLTYVEILLRAKLYPKVLDECSRLLKLAPESIAVASMKAEAQLGLKKYSEALDSYNELVAVHPFKELCLLKKGKVLRILGQSEEALESFRMAINIDATLGESYWQMANLRPNSINEHDVQTITELLDSNSITTDDRIFLNFSMGKVMEDRMEFAKSFNYYKIANDAKLDLNPLSDFPQNKNKTLFFTFEYFEDLKKNHSTSESPIFIIGFGGSGATLLEQILSSHSQIDGIGVVSEITTIARHLSLPENRSKLDYIDSLSKLNSDELENLAISYLDSVSEMRSGAPKFVVNLPDQFMHLGLIKSLFPNAKIIELCRNPVASGLNLYKKYFPERLEYASDLASIGKQYKNYITMMNHWHRVLPGQILRINYENLVVDLSSTAKTILTYCELDFEESCLEFYDNPRPVASINSEQVRQPLYQEGLTHWENYKPFLKPLMSALEK